MITVEGRFFRDAQTGCALLFRGINLSGLTKLPSDPDTPSYFPDLNTFYSSNPITFINRPSTLHDADDHLLRLRKYGFHLLRFLITWEAIEHAAPGIYDTEYLDFVVQYLHKAAKYGFKVFVDPHQDVWSRFTGGCGAPRWTLDLIGLDPIHLAQSESAVLHNQSDPYPRMCWSTNLFRLACATMYTVFFGGDEFAPLIKVGEEQVSIQEYLQTHYIQAVCAVVERIVKEGLHDTVVIGYDTLNEPSAGYIGVKDLAGYHHKQAFRTGPTPTLFEGMLMGQGQECSLPVYDTQWYGRFRKWSKVPRNTDHVKAWKPGVDCVWARHGVWDTSTGQLLKPNYFAVHQSGSKAGQPVDFHSEYWLPFVHRYARSIRKLHAEAIMFLEPEPFEKPPKFYSDPQAERKMENSEERIVYAPHWYDGATLSSKRWLPFNVDLTKIAHKSAGVSDFVLFRSFGIGNKGVTRVFSNSMAYLLALGQHEIGNHPLLIGEIGVPYDLVNKKHAFRRHDYSVQAQQINTHMAAMESSLLSFTWWTYVATNTYDLGDHWNGEDLSIVSKDCPTFGRAMEVICRPYALQTAGTPQTWSFVGGRKKAPPSENLAGSQFVYEYVSNRPVILPVDEENSNKEETAEHYLKMASESACTIIQLPRIHFSSVNDVRIEVKEKAHGQKAWTSVPILQDGKAGTKKQQQDRSASVSACLFAQGSPFLIQPFAASRQDFANADLDSMALVIYHPHCKLIDPSSEYQSCILSIKVVGS